MKRRLIGIVVIAALGTAPAVAADMAFKAPAVPVPVWSWAGFYIGGNVGYGWSSDPKTLTDTTATALTRITDADTPTPVFTGLGTTTATAAGSGTLKPDGWLGGFQAGYNWQRGAFVFGLEGDIQADGQRGSTTICDTAGCPTGSGIATDNFSSG
jgi:outer membrane immunogenic protein